MALLLIGALLTVNANYGACAEPKCTEDGCHHLDESVGLRDGEFSSLVSALSKLDPLLAAELRTKIKCESCPVQESLEPYCLLEVSINAESRVKVDAGRAKLVLKQGEWRTYLVKVANLAGVTAPLKTYSQQAVQLGTADSIAPSRDRWLEIEMSKPEPLPAKLTGNPLQYCIIRLRTDCVGKRTAVLAMDVGQGTADIGFRNDVMLTFVCQENESVGKDNSVAKTDGVEILEVATEESSKNLNNARRPRSEQERRKWLENMVWQHQYSIEEVHGATGLSQDFIAKELDRFNISAATKPRRSDENLLVIPYPGGKHPRIGFLEGAINPQRETKVSIFTPWDPSSYVVLDVPEAIWSNLGLTYLAHTHIPTLWEQQGIALEQLEWAESPDGSLECERELPNGIVFGTKLEPDSDAMHMEMWLTNGTAEALTDLRVQICGLLKFAKGSEQQNNDNKLFWGPYAACGNAAGDRWVIMGWDPIHRTWGNEDCPCVHADPQFPDCLPGETQRLRGWFSFFEGTNVFREMLRIDRTGWRDRGSGNSALKRLRGIVVDSETGQPLAARVHLQSEDGAWHFVESIGGDSVRYDRELKHLPDSPEVHTTLSADPFAAHLAPGKYTIRVERGKEYFPIVEDFKVGNEPLEMDFRLRRWIDMGQRGWFSGDTHVHRRIADLPNAMLAEDLNVAFPLTYWVTASDSPPLDANGEGELAADGLIEVDATHVIHPTNTEYEIFSVGPRRHTLGAVFVLNHESPLPIGAPPVEPVARLAQQQGALLDLDKHSWPWSLMLIPTMDIDLFELANNHVWQAEFAFKDWTLETCPEFMGVARDEDGFTEWGWIDYGFQAYYTLLNCGFRLRVSAGTATGVHPVQLGFGRVYVHLPDGFSYDKWIQGLDAGRSFVSTGPMLDVKFNDQPPGYTHETASPSDAVVRIRGIAESRRPLDRIEIIVNGRVSKTIKPRNEDRLNGGYASVFDESVERTESFWVAVRCFERHPQGRVRFAHTNPAFIDVADRPLRPRKAEIAYLVQRMEEEIESNAGILSDEALDEYRQALSVYQEIAQTAK